MFLAGKHAILVPCEPEHYDPLTRWINDPVTTYYLFYGQRPLTQAAGRKMLDRQVRDPQNVVLSVLGPNGESLCGFTGLYDTDLTAQRAEFRILLGAEHCGKGIGTEVTRMLVYYGFDRLNLHRVFLGVTSENSRAVKAYEKAGFVREGVLREDIFRNGRWYDTVRMAVLRDEYEQFAPEYRLLYGTTVTSG